MSSPSITTDTIAAVATPQGYGGVGIIRISGPLAKNISQTICDKTLTPRYAHYVPFLTEKKEVIDNGIALYFPAPNSFTGEDVFELQAHGGPIILDLLLNICTKLGARLAKAGEFSERAFMNDKLDLVQAEAIADLIDASSKQAARNALRSLQGEFSQRINQLNTQLTNLRIYVESAIDFPEEEIDFLADGHISKLLDNLYRNLVKLLKNANQGVLVREGMTVVIAGKPNVGKSSLLNSLAEKEIAIVTNVKGTTRDLLKEHIHIDGMPLHIIDTAGLRNNTSDSVEQVGIQRAINSINEADHILLVTENNKEDTDPLKIWPSFFTKKPDVKRITVIKNKIDLSNDNPTIKHNDSGLTTIQLSAQSKEGLSLLKEHLKKIMGYKNNEEGNFSARRRHIDALEQTLQHLEHGQEQLKDISAGELLAEDLKQAQDSLGEIIGKVSSDQLVGKIFSSFCIGK
ncbi:UNVERIFIED_CONTAM: hypothetical protein GTU68_008215 [Idotea baltica]|nr:hypothetical protein [Idotea baltica]